MIRLATALLATAANALVPPRPPTQTLAPRRARDEGVAHKIEIIEGEAVDPASDPSRPRWLYVPTMVPNASQWDVVLDANGTATGERSLNASAISPTSLYLTRSDAAITRSWTIAAVVTVRD